jgi:glucose-1-phosphate thymidylyltransferase
MTKGIVLAGGKGTRLFPTTVAISKQLHSVYNKPMIYYPLQTLKDMGITEILIITADEQQCRLFQEQLKDGEEYGLQLQYAIQSKPGGLPEAFIIGEHFIGVSDDIALILGDNVFITNKKLRAEPNTIYTYKVKNPSAYGVAELDENGNLANIVEKPTEYISDNAVVGLYVFTHAAIGIAKGLEPSARGELEIVDLISKLNEEEGLLVQELDGFWFDCGNHDDLLDCANLVRTIEHRTERKIGLHK